MCKLCKSTNVLIYKITPCSNSLMKFKMNMYKLKEGREMKASTFSKLVSTTLYEKR